MIAPTATRQEKSSEASSASVSGPTSRTNSPTKPWNAAVPSGEGHTRAAVGNFTVPFAAGEYRQATSRASSLTSHSSRGGSQRAVFTASRQLRFLLQSSRAPHSSSKAYKRVVPLSPTNALSSCLGYRLAWFCGSRVLCHLLKKPFRRGSNRDIFVNKFVCGSARMD